MAGPDGDHGRGGRGGGGVRWRGFPGSPGTTDEILHVLTEDEERRPISPSCFPSVLAFPFKVNEPMKRKVP